MAATRPCGVGPVVARPVTRRRAISVVVVCRATRCRAISAVVARPCTRRLVLRTRHRPIFFKFPYPSSRATHLSSRAVDPSSRAADPSSRPFPHPPCTRLRQPYKYARIFFSPHSVRASWPALATVTTCGIL